jgi:hypothetical protein
VTTKRGYQLALVLVLALVSLSGCTLDQIAAQQEKATGLWEELTGGQSYGQTFRSTHDNLYRIDLSTATYARINTAPVILHLRSSPQAATDIASMTLPGPEIQNERPTTFQFPPLADSGDKAYYFYIEAPGATAGNAITVYANAADRYLDGAAFRDGQAVEGDLAFTAYSRQSYSPAGVSHGFLSRLAQDVPFLLCYGLLILTVCALLVLTLRARAADSGK